MNSEIENVNILRDLLKASFKSSVELVVDIANIQSEIQGVINRIKFVKRIMNKVANDILSEVCNIDISHIGTRIYFDCTEDTDTLPELVDNSDCSYTDPASSNYCWHQASTRPSPTSR